LPFNMSTIRDRCEVQFATRAVGALAFALANLLTRFLASCFLVGYTLFAYMNAANLYKDLSTGTITQFLLIGATPLILYLAWRFMVCGLSALHELIDLDLTN